MPIYAFEEMVYQRIISSIAAWEPALRQDVYALCLLYGSGASADEQGREVYYQGWVSLSYNTNFHAQEEVARFGTNEPLWNNAFWLHDLTFFAPAIADYGTSPDDTELKLRNSWCASVGLKPDGMDESGRPSYNEPDLHKAIATLCGRVVLRLHQEKALIASFGRPRLVLIETDDWSDEALTATKDSNPVELLDDYLRWMHQRRHPNFD